MLNEELREKEKKELEDIQKQQENSDSIHKEEQAQTLDNWATCFQIVGFVVLIGGVILSIISSKYIDDFIFIGIILSVVSSLFPFAFAALLSVVASMRREQK